MPVYGGIEAGGTKFVCVIGSSPDNLLAETSFATTTPEETIDRAIAFFARYQQQDQSLVSLGIGSFGPVDLNPLGFVYVKDVALRHILAAKKGKVGQKYILSSENHKIRDIFQMLSEVSKTPVPKRGISSTMAKMLAYATRNSRLFSQRSLQGCLWGW
jgi:nucleoside-diphosphate-sugar epimerase